MFDSLRLAYSRMRPVMAGERPSPGPGKRQEWLIVLREECFCTGSSRALAASLEGAANGNGAHVTRQ